MDSINVSTDDVLTDNTTAYNDTSTTDIAINVPLNCGIIVLSTCSILCNIIALNIIHRCRKLSFQIRCVTYNLLASYILFESMILLHSVAMLLVGTMYGTLIFESRIFFGCALVATLWGSLCTVTIERLVALTVPLHYKRYVTKTTLSISIASLWTVTVITPLLAFIIAGINVCGQYNFISCDIYALFKPARIVLISFLILFALIISASYLKIIFITYKLKKLGKALIANSKYLSELSQKQKCTNSTKTVAVVILVFIVFQSPIFFHSILMDFKPELWTHRWRMIFQTIDYVGVQLNTYANLYLYICKFKECKMHLFFILAKCNGMFKAKADSLHIEVYDIVISESNRRRMKANSDNAI